MKKNDFGKIGVSLEDFKSAVILIVCIILAAGLLAFVGIISSM